MKVATLLLDAGADISVRDNWGGTAVHYAARNGYLDLLKVLYQQGRCDLEGEWYGKSPFQLAIEGRHVPVARWLKSVRFRGF